MPETLDMFDDPAPAPAAAPVPPLVAEAAREAAAALAVAARPEGVTSEAVKAKRKRFSIADAIVGIRPSSAFDIEGITSEWARATLEAIVGTDRSTYMSELPMSEVHEILAAAWVYAGARDEALAASRPAGEGVIALSGHRNVADALNDAWRVLDRHLVAGDLIPYQRNWLPESEALEEGEDAPRPAG